MPEKVELPDIYNTVEVKGRLIQSFELRWFLSLDVKVRLYYIRTYLNTLYPGEFTYEKVAVRGGLSHQAVRDTEQDRKEKREQEKRHRPNADTIEKLAWVYNIPESMFLGGTTEEEIGGFYLGKAEDEEAYFDDYYLTHRHVHPLDKRDRSYFQQGMGEEYIYVSPYGYSPNQYDVNEDGSLNRYTIEVVFKAFQTSTQHLLWEKRVGKQSEILPGDIKALDALFAEELQGAAERFEPLLLIQEDSKKKRLWEAFQSVINQMRLEHAAAVDKIYEALLCELNKVE